MNKLNNIIKVVLLSVAATLPASLFGLSSISGTALSNVTGVFDGDFAVLLVDTSGSPFNVAGLSSLAAGVDLTDSASYFGYQVLTTSSATTGFGVNVDINATNIDVNNQPIVSNDYFAILTFDGSSTTSVGGTSYEIWTQGNWRIPADSTVATFGSQFSQIISSSAGATGTVSPVPEPSSFALLAGCFGLAWVMVRRRS